MGCPDSVDPSLGSATYDSGSKQVIRSDKGLMLEISVFSISLWWLIHITLSVDKSTFSSDYNG